MNRRIRVTQAYADLRRAQRELNRFVWSTEISYGFTRAAEELRSRPNALIDEALSGIDTPAWHPPSCGPADASEEEEARVKYRHTVGDFLRDVERDSHFVCLTAMVMFSAAFESYLDSKPKGMRKGSAKENGTWGPYVQTLCGPAVYWPPGQAPGGHRQPLQFRTVLLADLSRLLRNQIAHAPGQISAALPEEKIDDMVCKLAKTRWNEALQVKNPGQWTRDTRNAVCKAIRSFEGSAQHKVARARETRNLALPIEYFYMLFSFGALNALAFELEEALIGSAEETDAVVLIDDGQVRRNDLWEDRGQPAPQRRPGTP